MASVSGTGYDVDSLSEPSYEERLEEYFKSISTEGPPAIPPPPIYKELAAETLKNTKALLRPVPNLFRSTFEQAQRQTPGESWLQKRLSIFDAGGRRKRKQVLEEFLEYVRDSSTSSMEELFSNQAHLFLVRLTSWFSVTLPLLYELPLQLKVFLTFLEFREQSIIRAFFQSGAVVLLMNALSSDFDVPDEVRCLALLVIHKLVLHGRAHKEVLCSRGLVSSLKECVNEGLRWETHKASGLLLGELFRSNPLYQDEVVTAIFELMSPHRRHVAQRVAIQVVTALISQEGAASRDWHTALVPKTLTLLDSQDLRVSADAYCLLSRLVSMFNCDALCFDFARREMNLQARDMNTWFQVEVDAAHHAASTSSERAEEAVHQNILLHMVAEAQQRSGIIKQDGMVGTQLLEKKLKFSGEFGEGFRKEAAHILKLGLLVFLAKRNPELCDELVTGGLTETLLMCLLDVARPMRQAAALSELQQLRLASTKVQQLAEAVLVKQAYVRAVSLDQFMAAGTADDLARARFRLRNLQESAAEQVQQKKKLRSHTAAEHELQQRLIERDINETLGMKAPKSSAFLTEGPEEALAFEDDTHDSDQVSEVPRTGADVFNVKRIPVPSNEGSASMDSRADARGYGFELEESTEHRNKGEPPVLTALFSLLADPLDMATDAGSVLQSLGGIQAPIRLSEPVRGPLPPAARKRPPRQKLSHQVYSINHARAVALGPLGFGREPVMSSPQRSKGSEAMSQSPSVAAFSEDARSEASSVSLLCVPLAPDKSPMHPNHGATCDCHTCHATRSSAFANEAFKHDSSLAETSLGIEASQETSHEDPSHELQSSSLQDTHAFEQSLLTIGSGSLLGPGGSLHSLQDDSVEEDEATEQGKVRPRILQKSTLATLVELPRLPLAKAALPETPMKTSAKKVLCVAPAPYHQCVAFSGQKDEDMLLNMLDPNRQQKFQNLQQVGKFPRRWLKSSGPSKDTAEPELHQPTPPPWSARSSRQPPLRREQSPPVSQRRVFSDVDKVADNQSWMAHAKNLKDFFPASARSAF